MAAPAPLRLALVRHAHAADGPDDEARPLTPQGAAAARAIGVRLADFFGPGAIAAYASTAARARATATALLLGGQLAGSLALDAALYASPDPAAAYLDLIALAPERSVVIVGHNPTVSAVAELLTGEPVDLAPAEAVTASFAGAAWPSRGLAHAWARLSPTG